MTSSTADVTKVVRVLIAEDNKVNQKVLRRMLETLGYNDVTVVENGQQAVEAVQASWDKFLITPSAGLYDIVLMDCLMPVMDGWTATEEIRRLEEKKLEEAHALSSESPAFQEAQPSVVLALTANATEEDRSRCSDCGMDGFYTKPMSRDALNALMLHWVSVLFGDEASVYSANSPSGNPKE